MEPTTPEGALDYSALISALRGAGRAAKQFVLPDPPDHSVVDDFPLPGEDQFAFMGRQARSPKWSQKVMEGATSAGPIRFNKDAGAYVVEDATQAMIDFLRGSKFKAKTGEPMVAFHGTNRSFDSFDPGSSTKLDRGWYGKAPAYFTIDPESAAGYATHRAYAYDGAPSLVPAVLRLENPYEVVRNHTPGFNALESSIRKSHGPGAIREILGDYDPKANTNLVFADKVADWLRGKGHDGVMAWDYPGGYLEEISVFDPRNIKSAIGARSYTPTDPSIIR